MERRFEGKTFIVTGPVDALMNNVGDMPSGQASWTEVTEEAIDHIVNVGSTVIVRGSPRAPQYAAGTYGLLGVTMLGA